MTGRSNAAYDKARRRAEVAEAKRAARRRRQQERRARALLRPELAACNAIRRQIEEQQLIAAGPAA